MGNKWVFIIGGRRITVYRKDRDYDRARTTAISVYHSRSLTQARKGTPYAVHHYNPNAKPKIDLIERPA